MALRIPIPGVSSFLRYHITLLFPPGVRITEETELGSNDTVKSPPVPETSRRARKKEKDAQMSVPCILSNNTILIS